jgi:aryl-alcohol dehydrogenase-like predicted oxidoreductase
VAVKTACRPLGKSGLSVSTLALGTVSLGVDYGIEAPGSFGRPDENEAARLLLRAADAGINLFDTAPAYGASESLLGKTLSGKTECLFATKVSVPENDARVRPLIHESLEKSLRHLRRETLDIVQIHNATVPMLARGEAVEALLAAKRQGKIRLLGASVYTEEEALAVILCGVFDVLQVAYNLLDQRMARRVFPAAAGAGIALILRSAFLKGALTEKARWLPEELSDLKSAVEELKQSSGGSWEGLTALALRFCLSAPEAASVLVGARTVAELEQALKIADEGPVAREALFRSSQRSFNDGWLNPSNWNVP